MDASTLLWGLLFASIGFVYYKFGRKRQRPVAIGCGAALVVFPYFVNDPVLMVVVGGGIMVLPFIFKN